MFLVYTPLQVLSLEEWSFSYQWLSDNTSINGANNSTFALTQDYVGKRISLKVSWSDGQGTEESLTSRATYPV